MYLSKRNYFVVGGSLLLIAAVALAAATRLHRTDPVTLPEETAIHVTLNQTLASDQSRPGDHFEATVAEPILIDGKTVIPEGAQVTGLVVDAHHSGRLMGRARLSLALEGVDVNGKTYEVRTLYSARVGGKHKKRNIALIAGSGGSGALIGAIAAGGKGALIGGPVGAGAGTAVAFFTGKKDIRLPAETAITFKLAEPVTIDAKG